MSDTTDDQRPDEERQVGSSESTEVHATHSDVDVTRQEVRHETGDIVNPKAKMEGSPKSVQIVGSNSGDINIHDHGGEAEKARLLELLEKEQEITKLEKQKANLQKSKKTAMEKKNKAEEAKTKAEEENDKLAQEREVIEQQIETQKEILKQLGEREQEAYWEEQDAAQREAEVSDEASKRDASDSTSTPLSDSDKERVDQLVSKFDERQAENPRDEEPEGEIAEEENQTEVDDSQSESSVAESTEPSDQPIVDAEEMSAVEKAYWDDLATRHEEMDQIEQEERERDAELLADEIRDREIDEMAANAKRVEREEEDARGLEDWDGLHVLESSDADEAVDDEAVDDGVEDEDDESDANFLVIEEPEDLPLLHTSAEATSPEDLPRPVVPVAPVAPVAPSVPTASAASSSPPTRLQRSWRRLCRFASRATAFTRQNTTPEGVALTGTTGAAGIWAFFNTKAAIANSLMIGSQAWTIGMSAVAPLGSLATLPFRKIAEARNCKRSEARLESFLKRMNTRGHNYGNANQYLSFASTELDRVDSEGEKEVMLSTREERYIKILNEQTVTQSLKHLSEDPQNEEGYTTAALNHILRTLHQINAHHSNPATRIPGCRNRAESNRLRVLARNLNDKDTRQSVARIAAASGRVLWLNRNRKYQRQLGATTLVTSGSAATILTTVGGAGLMTTALPLAAGLGGIIAYNKVNRRLRRKNRVEIRTATPPADPEKAPSLGTDPWKPFKRNNKKHEEAGVLGKTVDFVINGPKNLVTNTPATVKAVTVGGGGTVVAGALGAPVIGSIPVWFAALLGSAAGLLIYKKMKP